MSPNVELAARSKRFGRATGRQILTATAAGAAAESRHKSLSPQELRDLAGRPTPSVTRRNVGCSYLAWDVLVGQLRRRLDNCVLPRPPAADLVKSRVFCIIPRHARYRGLPV